MDLQTIVLSVFSSGLVAAVVTGWMNHRTQIRAIKESGLYTKRGEVFDSLMEKMESLKQSMSELVSIFQQDDGSQDAEFERRTKASNLFNDFIRYYHAKKHYLPKNLCKNMDILRDDYRKLFVDFVYEAHPIGEIPNARLWDELAEKMRTDLVLQEEKIADEFRKMIGVK